VKISNRGWFVLVSTAAATGARAQAYADPSGSGAIVGALHWIQGTLLGTVATVTAVIAAAIVGYMMLSGRLNWRHGVLVKAASQQGAFPQ